MTDDQRQEAAAVQAAEDAYRAAFDKEPPLWEDETAQARIEALTAAVTAGKALTTRDDDLADGDLY